MSNVESVATTGIGSLPHHNIDAALAYSFTHGIPFLPQIPIRNPWEFMIAAGARRSPGLQVEAMAASLEPEIWASRTRRLRRTALGAFAAPTRSATPLRHSSLRSRPRAAGRLFSGSLRKRGRKTRQNPDRGPDDLPVGAAAQRTESSLARQKHPDISAPDLPARSGARARDDQKAQGAGVTPILFLDEPGSTLNSPRNPQAHAGDASGAQAHGPDPAQRRRRRSGSIAAATRTGRGSRDGSQLSFARHGLSLESLLTSAQHELARDYLDRGGKLSLGVDSHGPLLGASLAGLPGALRAISSRSFLAGARAEELRARSPREALYTPACGLALQSMRGRRADSRGLDELSTRHAERRDCFAPACELLPKREELRALAPVRAGKSRPRRSRFRSSSRRARRATRSRRPRARRIGIFSALRRRLRNPDREPRGRRRGNRRARRRARPAASRAFASSRTAGPHGKGANLQRGLPGLARTPDLLHGRRSPLRPLVLRRSRPELRARLRFRHAAIAGCRRACSASPSACFALAYGRHRLGLWFNWAVRRLLPIRTTDTQAGHQGDVARARDRGVHAPALPGLFLRPRALPRPRARGASSGLELPVILHLNSEKSTVRIVRESLARRVLARRDLRAPSGAGAYGRARARLHAELPARYRGRLALGDARVSFARAGRSRPTRGSRPSCRPRARSSTWAAVTACSRSRRRSARPSARCLGIDHDPRRVALAQARPRRDVGNLSFERGRICPSCRRAGASRRVALIDVHALLRRAHAGATHRARARRARAGRPPPRPRGRSRTAASSRTGTASTRRSGDPKRVHEVRRQRELHFRSRRRLDGALRGRGLPGQRGAVHEPAFLGRPLRLQKKPQKRPEHDDA